MTEDEAKTKWCPFVRAAAPVDSEAAGTAGNRWGSSDPTDPASGYLCIASACMAWRWAGYRAADGTWVRKTADGPWKPENADGVCGLAGAPQ